MSFISKECFNRRFDRRRVIGKGSFGEVWEVVDRETKQKMALKSLRARTAEQLGETFQEIMVLFKVQHPSLVHLHHYYLHQTDHRHTLPYTLTHQGSFELGILMELGVANLGQDIEARMQGHSQDGHYSASQIEGLLHHMTSLLAQCQEQHIAHRDIKTENLILFPDGSMKLSDLGLVRIGCSAQERDYAGSPDYVSPQLRRYTHQKDISSLVHDVYRSDVFSLAVTLTNMALLQPSIKGLNTSPQKVDGVLHIMSSMKKFSSRFLQVLYAMFSYDEASRPDFVQLSKMLGECPQQPIRHHTTKAKNVGRPRPDSQCSQSTQRHTQSSCSLESLISSSKLKASLCSPKQPVFRLVPSEPYKTRKFFRAYLYPRQHGAMVQLQQDGQVETLQVDYPSIRSVLTQSCPTHGMIMAAPDLRVDKLRLTTQHHTLKIDLKDKVLCTANHQDVIVIVDKSNTMTIVEGEQVVVRHTLDHGASRVLVWPQENNYQVAVGNLGKVHLYQVQTGGGGSVQLQKSVDLRQLQEWPHQPSLTRDYVHCLVRLQSHQLAVGLADGSVFILDMEQNSNHRLYKVTSEYVVHIQGAVVNGLDYLVICDGQGSVALVRRGEVQRVELGGGVQRALVVGDTLICCREHSQVETYQLTSIIS